MNMIKDRIGRHEVLLPINYIHLRKKQIHVHLLEKIYLAETLFCRVSGCRYGFCNQLCYWGIWRSDWLWQMNVTFQFLFQSIITNYHFNWHISAFKPRFHTRTLVDRLHANIMALVRQDLQTKVTDAFVHLNTRAPIARKETVGKNAFFIRWNTFMKNST